MNQKTFSLFKLIFILFSVSITSIFTLSYCSKPSENLVVYVDGSIMKYSAVFHVYQTGTTNTVPPGLVFKITGKDSALIFDISGKRTIVIDGQGYIRVGVDPNYTLNSGASIDFNIETSAAGFIPVSLPVKLLTSGETVKVDVPMLNIKALPPDISAQTATQPIVGNTPAAPVTLATPPTSATGTTASITIPAGTQFRDASGAVMTGTNLVVTLVQTDVQSGITPNQIPGGNAQTNIQTTDPTKKSVFFTPASLVNLQVNLDGNTVSTYSKPIVVQTTFPNRINPATGSLSTNKDSLDVYIYENNTKQWSYGNRVGVSVINGTTTVTGSYTHNSIFNFNYPSAATPCTGGDLSLLVNDLNNVIDKNSSDLYILDFFDENNTTPNKAPLFSSYINPHNGDTIKVPSSAIPAGKKLRIKVYDMDYDHEQLNDSKRWTSSTDVASLYNKSKWSDLKLPDELVANDFCGVVLPFNINIPKPQVIFALSGSASCPSGSTVYYAENGETMFYKLKVNPTTPFNSTNVPYYDSWRVLGAFKNGTFTSKHILPGQTYAFQAYFGGQQGLKYDVLFPSNISSYPVTNGITKAAIDTAYKMKVNGVYCK